MELAGRTALVIGAQRPLGRAIAVALGERGADVAVAGVSRDEREDFLVHSVANELWALNRRSLAVPIDLRVPSLVEAAVQQVDSEWSRLDILVNAQDRLLALPFDETGPDEWAEMLDANLTSAALACQAAGRVMMRDHAMHARGGAIVSLISAPAVEGRTGFAAYAAAAGGLLALTRSLAAEWAEWDIAVAALDVGFAEAQLEAAAPAGASHPVALPGGAGTPNTEIATAVAALIESGESGVVRRLD